MAGQEFQPIQGMSDLYAPEVYLWQQVEEQARTVFPLYGYEPVRTPIVERTKVFTRSLGDTTDVVQKEMYSFEDRGGRHLSLRPEGTASVIRHIAGAGQDRQRARLYYMGPMFRAERPQAGRKRQFHQMGAECFGPPSAAADAECIALQAHLFQAWGLPDYKIQLNTRGLPDDRQAVVDGLREQLDPVREQLCEDCQRRYEANILRVLDCKQEQCRQYLEALPPMTAFMSEESRQYLDEVQQHLAALEIDFEVNPRLVRGLDYYMHTVWEVTHPALGAQDAVAGGGRYRVAMGSREIDGVGFALGMERLITCLQQRGVEAAEQGRPHVWVVSQSARAFTENLLLAMTLRRHGVACGIDLEGRSMKAQMRAAGKAGVAWVIIRGDREMDEGLFLVKDMEQGTQEELEMPDLMKRVLPQLQAERI